MYAPSAFLPFALATLGVFLGGLTHGVSPRGASSRNSPPLVLDTDPRLIRVVVGSQASGVASLRWVQTVFDYAAAAFEGGKLDAVRSGILFTTTLDPDWDTPYEFGGLVFDDPSCTECMAFAEEMLREAAQRFPNWRYKVFYGMFLLKRRNDTSAAIRVFEPLSRLQDPKAPSFVRGLSASILVDQQGVSQAVRRLAEIRWSDSSAQELASFFQMQAQTLLAKEAKLTPEETMKVAPVLQLVFESENAEERELALAGLQRLVESQGEERTRLFTIFSTLGVTAQESGSSRSP